MSIQITNEDCMDLLKRTPDKYYELAICDPPYGIKRAGQTERFTKEKKHKRKYFKDKGWDNSIPDSDYFNELIRVSKNQIIWGANYFVENIQNANSSCWVVWDKQNGENDFADCELAYCSFKTAVRRIQLRWHGMLQHDMKNKEIRIHPTQKPVKLYEWLLMNYAKEGDKILDTHGGSMSIALAVHNMNTQNKMNLSLNICELDKDYYEQGKIRYTNHIKQKTIFDL